MDGRATLNIDGRDNKGDGDPPGFFRRQFQPEPSRGKTIFDVLLGVVLPVLCFIFDPVIFRGNFFGGEPLFGRLKVPVYLMAFMEISALIIWLSAGKRVGRHSAALGGFLYAGALISLLIGILLLPLSIIGIALAGLGLLGFTPFLTSMVFWRNGQRAFEVSAEEAGGGRKLAATALALIVVLGFPVAAHLKISSLSRETLEKVLASDEAEAEAAAGRLRLLGYLTPTDTDKIVWTYHNEQNQDRRERLARLYFRITGTDIEARRTYLID